jgi:hypothetical protein
MRASSAFARDISRVTWPIAALAAFAWLFAPDSTAERHAGERLRLASVRCVEQPVLALGDADGSEIAMGFERRRATAAKH